MLTVRVIDEFMSTGDFDYLKDNLGKCTHPYELKIRDLFKLMDEKKAIDSRIRVYLTGNILPNTPAFREYKELVESRRVYNLMNNNKSQMYWADYVMWDKYNFWKKKYRPDLSVYKIKLKIVDLVRKYQKFSVYYEGSDSVEAKFNREDARARNLIRELTDLAIQAKMYAMKHFRNTNDIADYIRNCLYGLLRKRINWRNHKDQYIVQPTDVRGLFLISIPSKAGRIVTII